MYVQSAPSVRRLNRQNIGPIALRTPHTTPERPCAVNHLPNATPTLGQGLCTARFLLLGCYYSSQLASVQQLLKLSITLAAPIEATAHPECFLPGVAAGHG
jgi:hypothetical protein